MNNTGAANAGPTQSGANYIDATSMPWETANIPGGMKKVLYSDPATGMSTVMYKLEPGAVIPLHEHPELEQTYVLEGRLVDHLGECTAGNFVWRSPGSRHVAHCPDGALFIVFFMKPPRRITA